MAVISKGITLSYKVGEGSTYTELTNLQEIPELGGETESLEITTLADPAHIYTDGLINYGDLAFKFLYETEQYDTLMGDVVGNSANWQVALPDGTKCSFDGKCAVKLDGVGTNAVLTYTLTIKPTSAMSWGFGN